MAQAIDRVLIATDGSEGSAQAVRFAASLLAGSGAKVAVVHVVPITSIPLGTTSLRPEDKVERERTMWEGGQAILDGASGVLSPAGVPVEGRIERGEAAEEILRVAREEGVALIVVSSHGAGGADEEGLGGTSDAVVRSAPCPVLVVRR